MGIYPPPTQRPSLLLTHTTLTSHEPTPCDDPSFRREKLMNNDRDHVCCFVIDVMLIPYGAQHNKVVPLLQPK